LKATALLQSLRALQKKWPRSAWPAELRGWHLHEAEASERDQQWFAALFHLDWVLADARRIRSCAGAATWRQRALTRGGKDPAQRTEVKPRIPPRPPMAKAELIDLGGFYNAGLSETWLPSTTVKSGNDLSELPPKRAESSTACSSTREASSSFRAARWKTWARSFRGKWPTFPSIASASSSTFCTGQRGTRRSARRLGLPGMLRQRRHAGCAIGFRRERARMVVVPAAIADHIGSVRGLPGANTASRAVGMAVRLYQMRWFNQLRDVEIRSLDFYSSMARPAPFLLAVTAE